MDSLKSTLLTSILQEHRELIIAYSHPNSLTALASIGWAPTMNIDELALQACNHIFERRCTTQINSKILNVCGYCTFDYICPDASAENKSCCIVHLEEKLRDTLIVLRFFYTKAKVEYLEENCAIVANTLLGLDLDAYVVNDIRLFLRETCTTEYRAKNDGVKMLLEERIKLYKNTRKSHRDGSCRKPCGKPGRDGQLGKSSAVPGKYGSPGKARQKYVSTSSESSSDDSW